MTQAASFKVAVLMGGPSEEHAISLKSGCGVAQALKGRGWPVESIVIPKDAGLENTYGFTRRMLQQSGADVAFIALHGRFGEDGAVQRLCEELHLGYTGSNPEASRLGMDKIESRKRFEQAGLVVPRWQVIAREEADQPELLEGWPYPLVVKPSDQGSSIGVSVVREKSGLPQTLALAARYSRDILIEEFIQGREVTAGILGNEPLPVVEIRPHESFFDFTAKYTTGATDYLVPAPLAPEATQIVQQAGLIAHHALGCRHLSRADIILTPTGVPVVLEINTIPGFTPTSLLPKAAACVGVSYEQLCEKLVLMAHPRAAWVASV